VTARPRSRLLPGDVARVAATGLRTRRARAALSALGVAIGIASLVAVLGLSASSRAGLLAQLDRLGTNLLRVAPGQSLGGDDATLPEAAPATTRREAGVRRVAAVRRLEATVRRTDRIPPEETGGLGVVAAQPGVLATLEGAMARGRFLTAATERFPVVVLGAIAAERLGVERPGAQVYIGGRWWTVAGILRPLELAPDLDRSVLVGFGAAARLLGEERSATTIYVRTDPERVPETRALLASAANPEAPEEVTVSRPSDALEARAAARTALTGLLLGLGGVALLVGGIGIANTMLIGVLERRSEIGLRRAVGATRGHIRLQFLGESVLVGAVGGLAGLAGGAALTAVYAHSRGWATVVPAEALVAGPLAAVLIGALAGGYPASRAAGLSPTEALRSA
jgi:putative ABC transport system permease protein